MDAEAQGYLDDFALKLGEAVTRVSKKFDVVNIRMKYLYREMEGIKNKLSKIRPLNDTDAITLQARISEVDDRTKHRIETMKDMMIGMKQREILLVKTIDAMDRELRRLRKEVDSQKIAQPEESKKETSQTEKSLDDKIKMLDEEKVDPANPFGGELENVPMGAKPTEGGKPEGEK